VKKYRNLTKAELITRIQCLEKGSPAGPAALERERPRDDLQAYQIELETQNEELRETHHLLELSRDRYADLYDYAPVGYVTLDEKGLIREVNLTAAAMLGMQRPRLVGTPFSLYVVKNYQPAIREHLHRLAGPDGRAVTELGLTVKGRGAIPVEMQSVRVLDLERKTRLIRSSLTDIARRQQTEEALRESEARFRLMADQAPVLIWISGPDKLCTWFNRPWLEFTGRTMEQELGNGWAMGVHPDDLTRCLDTYVHSFDAQKPFAMEYRLRRHDGEWRWLYDQGVPLRGTGEPLTGYIGSCIDITERKQLEKEVLKISEREQRRIGQDLHDGLCQHLAGIEFRLIGLKQKLEDKSNPQASEAADLAQLVRQAIEDTRTLARGLSPVMLKPDGLMNALHELASNTEKAFDISCSFNCPAPVLIHDNAVATHLYRIAQEAVHNAIRHGKAKRVVIHLFAQNERMVLGVKDNGVGLAKNPRQHKGIGLRVMQYRAGMVGGSLAVQREPGGGTAVVCSLRSAPPVPKTGRKHSNHSRP
jgi:PAS domain S-box-containing protein